MIIISCVAIIYDISDVYVYIANSHIYIYY